MNFPAMYIEHVYLLFMVSLSVHCVDYEFPRGVAPSAAAFYDPFKDFVCFDGLVTIPFKYVNDDFCDCFDGSDEPGTSACSNGWFHCMNSGFVEMQIPSSRVNDGICDCCDGSDEYLSNHCHNTCSALHEIARARAEARAKILTQGNDMRLQLINQARQIRLLKEERLKKLEEERVEAEKLKETAEAQKNEAEEAENAALQVYRAQEEEAREARILKEREEAWREAHDVFMNLDSNHNNILDIEEIKVKQIFDRNKDGLVAEDEITWYRNALANGEVTEEAFHNAIWADIKPLFMMEKGLFTPPEAQDDDEHPEEEPEEAPEDAKQEGTSEEEEEEEEVPASDTEEVPPENSETSEEPNYDARTTRLIEEAKEARSQFDSAQNALQGIEREMNLIKEKLEMDYGPEDEYAPLDGQCFTFSDREYTYKFCPFNSVSQAPKSGGSETRLGSWSGWSTEGHGPAMIYDKGQSCWNGPQRSTKVFVECGAENAVINVIEPNKCEYQLLFKTPAACKVIEDSNKTQSHDEL